MTDVFELNMDGLVGPTHHYAGLSSGNIASTKNALSPANPAAAALQGIEKMRLLHHLGLKQAVTPPHQRPNLALLHQLGFEGRSFEQIRKAYAADSNLLSACYSASSMWTANAATISPSIDTKDHKVHFTAANLVSNLHRHQEANFSAKLLQCIFSDNEKFRHHQPLPKTNSLGDEGAANHNRLCAAHSRPGVHVFVYGKRSLPANNSYPRPQHFPARQTLEASQAIARKHLLNPGQVFFVSQNPDVIDQGVFHNDVISVANENLFLIHEDAFWQQAQFLQRLRESVDFPLKIIEVKRDQISVKDAVSSYLFNSQLITVSNEEIQHAMTLIAPQECQEHEGISSFIDDMIRDPENPLTSVHYLDLRQSMRNGGGPACLRLRVSLTKEELRAMHQGILVNDLLLDALSDWVKRHYRTELHVNDLADPSLIEESFTALDELTSILKLGPIYPFQN